MTDLRDQIADELARHAMSRTWDGIDRVRLGCICGHERATATAAELAADLPGFMRLHRLHVAGALLPLLRDPRTAQESA
jgi:hypothetical protein